MLGIVKAREYAWVVSLLLLVLVKVEFVVDSSDLGSRIGAALLGGDGHLREHVDERRLVGEFREDIGGVLGPQNLEELELSVAQSFLNPQVANGQVSNFPKAAAPGHPDSRRGI